MDYEKERINGLIEQLRNGDKTAFDEFYKLTSPKAYFIALKLTQNEHDAEDILQESYIKALEKLDEIDTSQNVMSWFCKIVANKSKDFIKGKKPLVFEGEDDTIFEDIPEDKIEFSPEENLNQEELRLEVMAAIDELTAEKRACIMMMYFGEMSVKEIAESIEVPESTVKNRLYTARKDLKSRFEKSGNVLYGAALGGIIIWALQKTSVTASAAFLASAASAEILAGIGASAATTASASAAAITTVTAATSTAATTAAATGTGLAAKVAALSVIQKVAVGIAATAVIGGGTAGVVTVVKTVTDKPEPTTLAEEVTTAPFITSKDAFNQIIVTTGTETGESTADNTSSTLTSRTSAPSERSTRASTSAKPTTTKPQTTQKTTAQRETTTQKETTTIKATTTGTGTTTNKVTTTVPTTVQTTVPTTVPTTQAAAIMTVDIIDMDSSVVETLSFSVPAGTALTKAYIIDSVRTKNYEPMAGVYGDNIGTVAQGGQTYHFEAEL